MLNHKLFSGPDRPVIQRKLKSQLARQWLPNHRWIFKFGTLFICGGQKMAPHANKWSPLDDAHE